MSFVNIEHFLIYCDEPECDNEQLLCFSDIEIATKIAKLLGWNFIYLPGEYYDESICSCPKCSKLKEKIKPTPENHNCIFIKFKKNGEPSINGRYLRCFFCGREKSPPKTQTCQ